MRFMATNFCTESQTTITASSEDPSFPASNLKNPLRSKRLRFDGVEDQTVVFDLQTSEPINSVVLLWPKEDGIRLTQSATIKIQANATNVWTAPSVDQTLTVDNVYSVASHFFSTDQSYRYWRVYIDDPTNPLGFIELGVVWLGKGIAIDDAQNGFKYSIVDRSTVVQTNFGHKYVDEYPQTAILELSYAFMEYDMIQTFEEAFRTNGNRKPVMVAVDPLATVFDKDHYLVYGNLSNKFGTKHLFYNLLDTDGIIIEELS